MPKANLIDSIIHFMNDGKINYLWLDCETTGLDPIKNDIVQFACIPVINGAAQKQFDEYCQPTNWSNIEEEALAVSGITRDQLKTFQSTETLVTKLIHFLRQFKVKFTIAGYNVSFDRDFLSMTFKKVNKEREYLELFTSDIRDTFKRAKRLKTQLQSPNLKLGTLAKHFNIDIVAHNALSDISATIKVDKILSDMLGETEIQIDDSYEILDVELPEPAQLHCHSMYSHTDAINSIQEWADWCDINKIPGFSVVDHGNAASLYHMTRLTSKAVGIPGCGLHVEHNGIKFYLSAWAVSEVGYRNVLKLSSIGWSSKIEDSGAEFPLLNLEQLIKYRDGIIFGVPGINGPARQLLLNRQLEAAENLILELRSSLDIRLELAAINVHRFYDSTIGFVGYNVDGGNVQKYINQFYYKLANKHSILFVPVADAHFIDPSDKIVQDCVSKNSYNDNRYFFESRHQIKSKEMYSILRHHIGTAFTEQEYVKSVRNTLDIVKLASGIKIKHSYHLPQINIPKEIQSRTDDYSTQCYYYTMHKIKEHGRWNDSPEYVDRFKKEIDVIMKNSTLNFLPYFLVYEDICRFARSSGFLQGIARGSAGGSLLSYYLKIIHVDPVAAGLPFERFLSHARIRAGSFPDIDLDIADKARPLVMQYLKDTYGLGFAQISTFSKMKTKNAIKDAMYALYGRNRNDPEIKAVCDEIDDSPQGVDEFDFLYGYVDQEGAEHQGEIHKKPILFNFFKHRPEVENMVKKLLGSIRGWSRHASAFVISTVDLSIDRVPTMVMADKELGDILVTQFDAPMVEKCGLVKADILGIKTLTTTSEAINLIHANHGINLLEEDKGVPMVYRLPDKDTGVFTDFYNKDTDSSFQFNTELIKGYAKEFAPLSKADLAAMTSLCRPGALDAPIYGTTATQYYMDVKNGKKEVKYLHSDLEPILKQSNGIFQYQEEIMSFLVNVVGYSWEESDIIRSAIAKKKHEVIMSTFSRIRDACISRGWSHDAIETICQQIQAFSRYSFNKSHSYAYAELGYITLYLKHHYPLEWWCSVLNNEDKEDKTRKYISYLGDKISPPSLKKPTDKYTIADDKIVAPISAIKGIGPAVVTEIVSKGPFQSIEHFMSSIDHTRANIGAISALIKGRAADTLMDLNIDNYIDRRKAFMKRYTSLRKSKAKFKDDMYDIDSMSIFMQEKEYNQAFNKSLLSFPEITTLLQAKWPGLKKTGRKGIPFYMQSGSSEETYVLGSIKVAEGLIKKGFDKDVGIILLYESSSYSFGTSKKTGRPWHKVSVILSDGYNSMEAIMWDTKKALGWSKNTIVYVGGKLKTGWKTPVSIDVRELTKVE
jgi:DNA polymerase-3 subunit alpha